MTQPTHELLQFFAYEHLPAHLREVSAPFCELARELVALPPADFEARGKELISARMAAWEAVPIANVEATWVGTKLDAARDWTWANMPYRIDVILRFVLEAKDCAVRAVLYKSPGAESL